MHEKATTSRAERPGNTVTDIDVFEMQARLCQALSHVTLLKIIHTLRAGPKRVADLAQASGLSQASVSRHLTILRNCGVVTAQRRGQEIIYHITSPKIVAVCDLMREVLVEQAAHQSDILCPAGQND
jgi:ArsR family transcriptional regulator